MQCPKTRWRSCPACQQRIQEQDLEDEYQLQSWFIRRINRFLAAQGKQLIGWDEILEGGLAEGACVMSWRVRTLSPPPPLSLPAPPVAALLPFPPWGLFRSLPLPFLPSLFPHYLSLPLQPFPSLPLSSSLFPPPPPPCLLFAVSCVMPSQALPVRPSFDCPFCTFHHVHAKANFSMQPSA